MKTDLRIKEIYMKIRYYVPVYGILEGDSK
jgi:hypothetical protein